MARVKGGTVARKRRKKVLVKISQKLNLFLSLNSIKKTISNIMPLKISFKHLVKTRCFFDLTSYFMTSTNK